MSGESKPDLQLEIAHLLLIDVVGYSRLIVDEQIELLQELNRVVRSAERFRLAEASGKLIRLSTGDGMALLFFRSPEEPVQCALEISKALQLHPQIQLRMGIHSGPVNEVIDVNDRSNIAGAGINVAQRVMDCGDAGHILVSKHVADDLAQYRHWQPYLYDLGECEVKHGLRLHIVNLCKDGLGNPEIPAKLKRGTKRKQSDAGTRPTTALHWLNWPSLGILIFSILAIVFFLFFHRALPTIGPGAPNTISEKSIAVLPFDNLSDEKQNEFFTDAVQDEILNGLAKVADLKVISRTSTMQYRGGATRNLREIASALGVSHVLEGSVQRSGNRVRVTAQLIDARTDAHVWAEGYERDVADVFALESELAETIVGQLKARLSSSEKAAIELRPTDNAAAYDLYLRAKALIATIGFNSAVKENLFESVRLLEKAIQRDPQFFLANYWLARVQDEIYILGIDHTPARLALAEAAVRKGLELRPEAGEAHLALAQHLYCGYFDYAQEAREELTIARRSLPNDPLPIVLAGYMDRRQGHWEESIRNLEDALHLDPRNLQTLQQLSLSYLVTRHYPRAVSTLDRALAIAPNDVRNRLAKALVELEWRANTKPLHTTIDAILTENPSAATNIASQWFYLALYERDRTATDRALAVFTEDGCRVEGVPFPNAWCEGTVKRSINDAAGARIAFQRARAEILNTLRVQPDYGEALAVLAMADAALGNTKDAIREGRRAVELVPITKDSINGVLVLQYLAVVYAWSGEKERALEQIRKLMNMPGFLSYGQLRLDPYWDPLQGDPRFQKIVSSLAPK